MHFANGTYLAIRWAKKSSVACVSEIIKCRRGLSTSAAFFNSPGSSFYSTLLQLKGSNIFEYL